MNRTKPLITAIVILLLIGVASLLYVTGGSVDRSNKIDSVNRHYYFWATIIEVHPTNDLIVEPDISSIERRSSDKISLSANYERDWKIGDRVFIHYDGVIRESYPAQIGRASVQVYDNSSNITIKDGSISSSGLVLVLTNESDKGISYGESYYIEYKDGDVWKPRQPTITGNYAFIMIAYGLNAGQSVEKDINWEWIYGKLPKGEYRIIQSIGSDVNQVEFFIK